MEATANNLLTPHYYRDNFLRLCDTVQAQYGDILCDEEQQLLSRFNTLSFHAQCLYIRLVSRTGPWFRESKLTYSEIGEITPLLDELLDHNMAETAGTLTFEELGKLYTRPELQTVFSEHLATTGSSKKAALMEAIVGLQLDKAAIARALNGFEQTRLVAAIGVELVARFQILFFGNRHQSLTEFVLEDLGVTRYYPYPLAREQRFFKHREAFEEYLHCAALADSRYELLDNGDFDVLQELAVEVLDTAIRFDSSQQRWQKLCNRLARDLERLEEWDLALQLYTQGQAHPARERSARILEKSGELNLARTLCDEILADPSCEAELDAASRILPRVVRKLGGEKMVRRRDQFEKIELKLPRGENCVELLAAQHLTGQWNSVHYLENSLMNTLFGLAFWEQIFAPVPGVFHHPFQSIPTDMYDTSFKRRREEALQKRIAQLGAGDLSAQIHTAYDRYKFYQCRWVDWRYIDGDLLDKVTQCIPSEHLINIWERMLFDPSENRRGFPDLIALGKAPGEYCMIEVKGPGDALQNSQKLWLRFFATQQIPAQVAWVTWADD